MKKILKTMLICLLPFFVSAQGGMWLPLHLKKQNEQEMKAFGCKIKADQIYNPDKPSVLNAICQFGGGCTGEIISPQGLLLTNHHCGFDAIQSHSTLEHNYVDDGFWAKDKASELSNQGLTAMFVTKIEDVTIAALKDVTSDMGDRDRQATIDRNIASIKSYTRKKKGEELLIRPFYNGNQYFMFFTVTYKDVRLVGAPPSSIGKFGADTDNWVWPRHTGDFSLFRVYMGKDSLPNEYAPDNIPLIPKHYLPISLDGVREGDFTMVYGFPGRTDEYLSAAAVRQTAEVLNPARIAVRDGVLKTLDTYMRNDPSIKIAYVAKQAGIANAWKKWRGETLGIKTYGALDKKIQYEADFTRRIKDNPTLFYKYGNLLPRFDELYKEIQPYALTRDYYLEVFVRNCELFSQIAGLDSWVKSYAAQGVGAFSSKIPQVKAAQKEFFKDYNAKVDHSVVAGALELYAKNVKKEWGTDVIETAVAKQGGYEQLATYLVGNSVVSSESNMMALLDKKPDDIVLLWEKDPAVQFWREVTAIYQKNVAPKVQEIQPTLTAMQRQYMAGQMEVFTEKRFFPDANSTLRLTYGQVRGFRPKDALIYDHQTYMDGIMEKYIPGDYEFDVPKKLLELWKTKDFGNYATAEGRMPVAFLGSNHTTGGNSGSPALDARGNLIGLNFDRVWEGTMSDLNYDPAVCRNIMVDIRYVLFIIDKYAGAQNLIDEMTIVKGKKKK